MAAPTYNVVTVTGQVIYTNSVGDPVTATLTCLAPYFDNSNGVLVNPQAITASADDTGVFSLPGIIDPTPDGSGLAWSLVVKDSSSTLYTQHVQIGNAGGASQNWLTLGTAQVNPVVTTYLPKSGGAMTGQLAPSVSVLTDAANISVNAALGNDFRVTLGGNRTVSAPSNPLDGQSSVFEVIQDSTGSRTLTWASGTGGFDFGSSAAPTLSTAAGSRDLVTFRYSSSKNAWMFTGAGLGY